MGRMFDAARDVYGPLQDRADELGVIGGAVRHSPIRQYFGLNEIAHRPIDRFSRGARVLTVYECRTKQGERWIAEVNLFSGDDGQRWLIWVFDERPDRETIKEAYLLERSYGRRVLKK